MKETIRILIAGIFLTLLVTGCPDFSAPGGVTGDAGNVTITVDTGRAARTVRPNDITAASAFERIELEFSKGGAVKILTLNKGSNSGTTSLETGTWSINARGFMKIDEREYEAAQGSALVNVSLGSQNVSIVLQTGILSGRPGVFSYNIDFPGDVTEAVLEINSLPDLHGYEVSTDGRTVNLMQGKAGSFELLPGYYLLTITAKTGATMAIWNELVHIYSGQETVASHTLVAGNFSGTVTLSGTVYGGEFDGNHLTGAVVTAYSDENYLNRIASVNVSSFTKMTETPYYYSGSWSMTVPGSLSGKNVYFRVEETLGGPAGTRSHVWDNDWPFTVSDGVTPNINLGTSYIWGKWEFEDKDTVNFTVGADGTVTVITTEAVENEWDIWQQHISFSFPAENGIRYAYEFEAWTESGTRKLGVQYIDNSKYGIYEGKNYTIDTTRETFTLVSDYRFDPNVRRQLAFQVAYPVIGTLYIKIKSIKPANEYIPPDIGDTPRFTATAAEGGIKLRADLRGLSDGLRGIMIYEEKTGSYFTTDWIWDSEWGPEPPDFYEILFPYVEADKEYTFRLEYQGDILLGRPSATATATSGRGELVFANASELSLIKEGDTVKFNKIPVLSDFDDTNASNKRYMFDMASGASWTDPLAQWRYNYYLGSSPSPIDLIAILEELPDWVPIAEFLGKTCFAGMYYAFTYTDADVYLEGHLDGLPYGSFRTVGIYSTPFIYPNELPDIFTAEPHPEGVKLSVDLTRIPTSTESLYFFLVNDESARFWVWVGDWGGNYGQDTLEIIYPFVQDGKTYTFQVEYQGSGAVGKATVTTTAGLGELYVTNAANIGLVYSSGTKTLSLTGTPTVSSIASSPYIEETLWYWQYYQGNNFDDSEWKDGVIYEELETSVVFDNTFNSYLGSELSDTVVFVNVTYYVAYRGFFFYCDVAVSPSFRFPYFDPAVEIGVGTAFDTNNQLYLDYSDSVWKGDYLWANVQYYGDYYDSLSYTWFINGIRQVGYTDASVYLPTTDLSPGINYGLVVVTIDGVPFAKEFAFRVYGN